MTSDRWDALIKQWHAPASHDVFLALQAAYSEPHRKYHSTQHIEDCLAQLDGAMPIIDEPAEVEVALWFHDAVYETASSKNELRSAEWAQEFLRSIGVDENRCRRVYDHIMATRHGVDSLNGDAAVVVDIDLSILGREPESYDVYEHAIREEYKWVPRPVYRRKRIEILKSFLDRPAIFQTDHFSSRYESQARRNLGRAIEELGG